MKTNTTPISSAKPISVPIPYDRMPITSIGRSPSAANDRRKARSSGLQLADDVVDLGGVMPRIDAVGGVADDALLVDHEGRAHQALACARRRSPSPAARRSARQTSPSGSDSRPIDRPCLSRNSACVRQSSRDTPRMTQLQRPNSSSWSENSAACMRAAGRVVARVEVQHDVLLAEERRQLHRLHVGIRQGEHGSVLSWLKHVVVCGKFYACDRHLTSAASHVVAHAATLYNPSMEEALLGGLSPQVFLRRHWQKRPLLVRRALPGFRGVIEKTCAVRARRAR